MPFAELHCKSNFSFLEGASHPEELVQRAAECGYRALAITDRNSLAGVVRAHAEAKSLGQKLVIGAEITLTDAPSVVLWATDRAAYGRLSRLITIGRRRAPKGQCQLAFQDIVDHHPALLAGVLLGAEDPPSQGEERRPGRGLVDQLRAFRELFGERASLLAETHRGADDSAAINRLAGLSRASGLPLAASQGVHYHVRSRQSLQDVLTAIRHGMTVQQARPHLFPNAERHMHPVEAVLDRFRDHPRACRRTLEIAEQCRFSLDELRYEYPEELAPAGRSPLEHLTDLTWEGALERFPGGVPEKVRRLLEHELKLIRELSYEAYFLTVWDLVRFARQRGILCQGRGSAANSAVCYCLGVTSVDPAEMDLLFERFVSRERNEAPDIDIDFEHERREEVLQYIYEKYGRERAGMTAVVITYRTRSAVRDVGKALGLSLDRLDALAKQVEGHANDTQLVERCRAAGIDPESELGRRLIYLTEELTGFPRHLSQHVGGMVITRGPLCELAPIENAAMEGRTVIEWNKDDLDELGVLKVDCLSLGMLTAIRKCFDLVRHSDGRSLSLASIRPGDEAVYDMICRAETMGVFQIESRAQMSMLPRLRPRCYYDLVIEVAIVRPGPIQGQMVHPYLRRRSGEERVEYPSEAIREALHKTLGVPIFQEQAMRLAVVAAGFTPGEADNLRRAMGAWRRPGVIDKFRQKLIDGMRARGLSEAFAAQVFQQIRGFGEYGFPESHAASFALLVYVSAWLKHHYPAAFLASLLNSQPMGFYAPAQLIREARRQGVAVLPIDVNASCWDCRLAPAPQSGDGSSPWAVRLGLRLVGGLPQAVAGRIESARQERPFTSFGDFRRRTGFSRAILVRLADADAFGALSQGRRDALWRALGEAEKERPMPLLDGIVEEDEPEISLPPLAPEEEVFADYTSAGFSLKGHPIGFHRPSLDALQVTSAAGLAQLNNNRRVRVAGLVILRQRPSTAKGITFVTLEDETGHANLVVRQAVWERYYQIARTSPAWIAHGKLERKGSVIHVVVQRLEDLSSKLRELRLKSRDFR